MRPSILALSHLVLVPGLSSAVPAQPSLTAGDRVRLTAPTVRASPYVGTLESVRADTILVRSGPNVLSAFPLDRVTRVELSRGVRVPTWANTALIWMPLAGAGLSAIGGAAKPASRTSRRDSAARIAPFGGAVGLIAGLVTMIVVGPTDVWETVPIRRGSRTSLAPSPYVAPGTHGLTLGLHAAF